MPVQAEQPGNRLGRKQYGKAQQTRQDETKQHGVPVHQRGLPDAPGPPAARDQRSGSDGDAHQDGLDEKIYPVPRRYRSHFAGAQPGDNLYMDETYRVEQQVGDNRGPRQAPDTVSGA